MHALDLSNLYILRAIGVLFFFFKILSEDRRGEGEEGVGVLFREVHSDQRIFIYF